jgi:hypothetical protein
LIRIHIGNGVGRTGFDTGRIAAAQITLDYLAGITAVIHCAERASDSADFAAYTSRLEYDFCPGIGIISDGIHRTGLHTPGFGTLGAGIGHEPPLIVKCKYTNSGLGRIEYAFVFQ